MRHIGMVILGEHATGSDLSDSVLTERFTEAARRAISFARQEAWHRGDPAVTVADLLAGLGVDENSRANRIGSLKANAFYLRWLVGLPALPARVEESIECSEEGEAEGQLELDAEAR